MEQPITGTFLGTRGYLSPEQLSRRDYTKAVDSWALGVIVFGKNIDVCVRGTFHAQRKSSHSLTHSLINNLLLFRIFAVLLCGCLPFDDDSSAITNEDLVRVKFTLRYPRWAKNLSPSAKDLLSHLLDTNPATRYTADQAKDHPWVRGVTANKDKLLASPGRIKKSPMLMGSGRVGGRFTPGGGRRKDVHTPPTPQGPMVRKTSF
jgi:serine/threonine protein kinase